MTTNTNIIAVQDVAGLTNTGAIVWWRLKGEAGVTCLADSLAEVKFAPPGEPTPEAALRRAIGSSGAARGERKLARRMDERGRRMAVVRESVVEGQDDLDYAVEVRAILEKRDDGNIVLSTTPRVDSVHAAYEAALGQYTSDDVGLWLARKVVEACDGVSLRDTGGVYFVPAHGMVRFREITNAVKKCASHSFFAVPAYRGSEAMDDATAGILDALSQSIATGLAKIEAAAEAGLGARAATTQKAAIAALEARVKRYEALLGVQAAGLHEACERLSEHSAFNTLADMGDAFAGLSFPGA